MRMRKLLAFVLTLAMLLGNVTPAFAADNAVGGNISGDVTITSDENGKLVLTKNAPKETGSEEGESEVISDEEEEPSDGAGNDNNEPESDGGDSGDDEPTPEPENQKEDPAPDNGNGGDDTGSNDGEGGNAPDANEGDDGNNTGSNEGDDGSDTGSNEGDGGNNTGTDEGANGDDTGSDEGESGTDTGSNEGDGGNIPGSENGEGEDDPSLNEGEEGEDPDLEDDDESEIEEEEDELNPEEEEILEEDEESLSDNSLPEDELSVSDNDISISVNDLPMKKNENGKIKVYEQNDKGVQVNTYVFDTLGKLETFIKEDTKENYLYEVYVEEDMELNGKLDLTSEKKAEIYLSFLPEYTLTVKGDSSIHVNSLQGTNLVLEEGAKLQLLPTQTKPLAQGAPEVRLSVGGNTFTMGSGSTLVLGDADAFGIATAYVEFQENNTLNGFENAGLSLKGDVAFMKTLRTQYWEDCETFGQAGADLNHNNRFLAVKTLTIENRKAFITQNKYNMLIQDIAVVGVPLGAENLYITGSLEGTTVNASNIEATVGSQITVCRGSEFNNVEVTEKEGVELPFEKGLNVIFQMVFNDEPQPQFLTIGSLNLTGELSPHEEGKPALILRKNQVNHINTETRPGWSTGYIDDGEVLVSIQSKQDSALTVENYQVSRDHHGNYYDVELVEEEGSHFLKSIYLEPMDVIDPVVSVSYRQGEGVEKGYRTFASLDRAKQYIQNKSSDLDEYSNTIFYMTLLKDTDVYYEDLNYEDLLQGIIVNFDLNGNNITAQDYLYLSGKNISITNNNSEDTESKILALNGGLNLKSDEMNMVEDKPQGYVQRNLSGISVEAKHIHVESGDWIFKSITANDIYVKSNMDEFGNGERAVLNASTITINKGSLGVEGRIGSYGWNKETDLRPTIILNEAKIWVSGECYVDTLTAEKAFIGETQKDYTVDNNGQFFIKELNMSAGTLVNRGNMIVRDIKEIKDFINEAGGSLICNTFEQLAGSKTYLGDSRLLINDKGTFYNVNLGPKDGGGGRPILGLGATDVEVETDGKKEKLRKRAEISILGTFTQNEEGMYLEFVATDSYMTLEELKGSGTCFNPLASKDTENPESFPLDPETLLLESGTTLFKTDHKAFPIDSIRVLQEDEENYPTSAVHYMDTATKTNEVRVSGRLVTLCYINAQGWPQEIKGFTTWKDALAYLSAIGNPNTSYVLRLESDVNVGGALKLPSNVASVEIRGNEEQPIEFTFDKKLELTVPTAFANLDLPKDLEIDIKGKWLGLYEMNDSIKSLTSKTPGRLLIQDSSVDITQSITGMESVDIVSSDVITEGNFEVDFLNVVNNVNKEGDRPSSLTANKIVITDIRIVGERNEFCYNEGLEIKENLTSYSKVWNEEYEYYEEVIDNSEVYAVHQGGAYQVSESDVQGAIAFKKNAISLIYGTKDERNGDVLAKAPKISAQWFVYERDENGSEIDSVTHKIKDEIIYGPKIGTNPVTLQMDVEGELTFVETYPSMQDAFDEIERIGDSKQVYVITLKDNVGDATTNYIFPSKAEYVRIAGEGEKRTITFKNTADIKCNLDFENVSLKAADDTATLTINGYGVGILDSVLSENIAIAGSGTAKGSVLSIAGSEEIGDFVRCQSIKDIQSLTIVATEVYVEGSTTTGDLLLGRGAALCGEGAIKTGDVQCWGEGTIVTFPKETFDKKGNLTAITSTLEITGELTLMDIEENQGEGNPEGEGEEGDSGIYSGTFVLMLGKSITGENGVPKVEYYEDSEEDLPEELVKADKIILAKAPKVATQDVLFAKESGMMFGFLGKKAGNIIYKGDEEATVVLSYFNSIGNEIFTEFATFADAVAEINSLKTKRDYTITFINPSMDEETDEIKPVTLTMPTAANVDTLTLTSDDVTVYYLKDLSFPSNVILRDIDFVQMVDAGTDEEGNKVYNPSDEAEYSTAVSVKASGSFITMEGLLTFNTPIILSGGKNTQLTIERESSVLASPDGTDNGDGSYIQGKITGFGKVILNNALYLDYWQTAETKYTAAELNVAILEVRESEEDADVIIGSEPPTDDDEEVINVTNTLKVTDMFMYSSNIKVYGNAELKNVTLSGATPSIEATGAKFNITGLLTSTATGAKLITSVDSKKKQSVLNISGQAVLEDTREHRITVCVKGEEGQLDTLTQIVEEGVYLSKPLLTAKNISADVFLVDSECVKGSQEFNFNTGTEGYFLRKNGSVIEVHHSSGVQAVLCRTDEIPEDENEEIPVINYYQTLNEAIAQIKVLNDVNQEYTIMLLKDVGVEGQEATDGQPAIADAPYPMTVPEKAAKVTFTTASYNAEEQVKANLYIKTNINQKANLAFENIDVENNGTWDTKKLNLELNNAEIISHGKSVMTDLSLVNGSRFIADNTLTATALSLAGGSNVRTIKTANITKLTLADGSILHANDTANITDIISVVGGPANAINYTKAALTIKGYITYVDEEGEVIPFEEYGSFPFVVLNANMDVDVTYVETTDEDYGTDEDDGITKYDLKKATKLVTLEKETTSNFDFNYEEDESETVVWASKGVYAVDLDYPYMVYVGKYNSEVEAYELGNVCLDMTEATNFINTLSDKNGDYTLWVVGDPYGDVVAEINDTNVTDKNARSELVLPGKDKARSVYISPLELDPEHPENNLIPKINFTKNLKVYGNVTFDGIILDNDKEFSISMDKNSNGDSSLYLYYSALSNLKNITGKKGVSDVTIEYCYSDFGAYKSFMVGGEDDIYPEIALTGGITDVANMTLNGRIITNAKSSADNLFISFSGQWDACAATTIGNVALDLQMYVDEETYPGTYFGTYYSKDKNGNSTGIPQLTITGKVTGGKLPVKIFDFETVENYNDKKLVLAKAESAEQFIAKGYAEYNEGTEKYELKEDIGNILSYKDKSGYVMNGNIDAKQVILGQKDELGNWTESYMNTYAEAIEIINASGNNKAEYTITLQHGNKNSEEGKPVTYDNVVMTAADGANAKLGGLTLPKAGKAKSLRIVGGSNAQILKFTGAIQANCDVEFSNLTLEEVKVSKNVETTVDGITVKPNSYQVSFAEDVSVEASTGFKEIHFEDLIFKTIDGNKGSVKFEEATSVYVAGDIKLKELMVRDREDESDTTNILCEGNITVSDIIYNNDDIDNNAGVTLEIIGKKAVTLTDVSTTKDIATNNVLDITTYYKNKELTKSETQLSINGEIDNDIIVKVKPYVYVDYGYGLECIPLDKWVASNLIIGSQMASKAFQKVIKAHKLQVEKQDEYQRVALMQFAYVEDLQGFDWVDTGYNAVKQDGGVYFTNEHPQVQVIAQDINSNILYEAEFFNWEQAVKEIDKLDHKDWTYTITLLEGYLPKEPIKTLTLPAKAAKVIVDGRDVKGLATLSTKVSLKTETEFKNITVGAMKKTGNNYYGTPLTLDVGKNKLTLTGLKQGCDMRELGYLNSQIKLSGSANSEVIITPENIPQERAHENGYCGIYMQISKVGNVTLNKAVVIGNGQVPEARECYYDIKDGIQGVKELILTEGVNVGAGKSEVSLTDLVIGEPTGDIIEEGHEYIDGEGQMRENVDTYLRRNDLSSRVEAKNITVSGTTTMASAALKAGTTTVGDGKITLNNVIFRDTNNDLEGKQDNKGNSLITIKGTVTYDAEYIEKTNSEHRAAVCISLYMNNSTRNYAKLAEGMILLTAPKAPSSMFSPNYDWLDNNNTPGDGDDDTYYSNMGPWVEYMELYNSGNSIKYGYRDSMEAKVYVGTATLDEENGEKPSYTYATFEEAVKAIDSMALYKAGTREWEDYTLEMMKEHIEIGNDKADGKYSNLTLPSKASNFTLWGYGQTLHFAGNITLKCNTEFIGVTMMPMKAQKGYAIPTTANLAVGKFEATIRHAAFGFDTESGYQTTLNNITGSNGKLIICDPVYVEVNNISGISLEYVGNGNGFQMGSDEYGEYYLTGYVRASGNVTLKSLIFKEYAAGVLNSAGKITIDTVHLYGETHPEICVSDKYPLQLKGENKATKSVFRYEDGSSNTTENILLNVFSYAGPEVPVGTKVITGKYLDPQDWNVISYWMDGSTSNDLYLNGNDLYLGNGEMG